MISVRQASILGRSHDVYGQYRDAFNGLAATAVQRHVMHLGEWEDVMQDPRIWKFVATDDGEFVGLSTITNDLEAWPLISPDYFRANYPAESARQDVWYIGFAFAVANRRAVLPYLLGAMYPLSHKGVSIMDFCTENVDRGLPEYTRGILEKVNPDVGMHLIDAQEFWAIDFQAGVDTSTATL